ncbi:MAG: SPW repeat protein [Phycisphaerales bacterium]|jgi:hypothetical protein|nr:SPW repeat protein [Phycisphaerales bacterium]
MVHFAHRRDQVFTASLGSLLCGIWIFFAPVAFHYQRVSALVIGLVFGLLIGLVSAIRFFGAFRASWLSWLGLLFSLLVMASPFVLGFWNRATYAMWTNVVIGATAAGCFLWAALATDLPPDDTPA